MTTAFFDEADPVAALFRAIQSWLGLPVTGVWDKATHDGFGVFLGRGSWPAWGKLEASWTQAEVDAVEQVRSGLQTVPRLIGVLPLSGVVDDESEVALLAALGLPTTSWAEVHVVFDPASDRIQVAMARAFDVAVASVKAAARPPWYKRTSTWVVVGGLVVVGGGVIWMRTRKGG